ncbi:MAG: MBL fold metallo-hydrolase [Spirochaetes bacterium]|nr:MAG: MBL fold metallo-hydrolase [Spirochaetota bacterium]
MNIVTLENGPFQVNSYLLYDMSARSGIIIDPGSSIQELLARIEKENIQLQAILCTHGHIDHVAGVNEVKARFGVPLWMNRGDSELLETLPQQARMFGVKNPGPVVIDVELPGEGAVEIGGITITLLRTPGHSPGSLSFVIDDTVFSGDTLFNFSIGRTDLPGGSYEALIASIENKLFALPDDTRVLSGHGPETTIGKEKEFNPFFG